MILTKIQKIQVQQVPGTHSHVTCLTDHRAVTLLININENQRGPNYWKLNTSLLEDENYKAIIKDLIHRYNTKLEYEKTRCRFTHPLGTIKTGNSYYKYFIFKITIEIL